MRIGGLAWVAALQMCCRDGEYFTNIAIVPEIRLVDLLEYAYSQKYACQPTLHSCQSHIELFCAYSDIASCQRCCPLPRVRLQLLPHCHLQAPACRRIYAAAAASDEKAATCAYRAKSLACTAKTTNSLQIEPPHRLKFRQQQLRGPPAVAEQPLPQSGLMSSN